MNLNMIDGSFTGYLAGNTASSCSGMTSSLTVQQFALFFPQAKLGGGNYVYVWSGGCCNGSGTANNGVNYFGIMAITGAGNELFTNPNNPGLTVLQAYQIDKKMDDGLAMTGRVTATIGASASYFSPGAAADNSTTCFNTSTNAYSIGISGGSNINCALSFQFQ
jgi:hypothetical protein